MNLKIIGSLGEVKVTLTSREAMQMAIGQGRLGAGFVSPNPLVGCVILDKNFALIGQGYHARVGEYHAEIAAVKSVRDLSTLNGAHVYVTLEPCAHQGRTPPCALTLAQLPIESVTFGVLDPNPLVSGKGAQILRSAGKQVTQFLELQDELEELAEIFLLNMHQQRPFVALKVAMTLDGKMALPDGTSQWITNLQSRAHVHSLRGCYDSILIGSGTFLKDNPHLTARDPRFEHKPFPAVVLDPHGECLASMMSSNLRQTRSEDQVLVVTGEGIPLSKGCRHLRLPVVDGKFSMRQVLTNLWSEGLRSVFVEGGAFTFGTFLAEGLVDRMYVYIAPKVFGSGLSWIAGWSAISMFQAVSLERVQVQTFAEDVLLTGRVFSK